jgi:uncharacterized protein (TIGR04222 family)
MNPFDLAGPQFLMFYAGLSLVVGGFIWFSRHQNEKEKSVAAPELTDPYLVAYLRAGPQEVWRLATIRLIDRGLMQVNEGRISTLPDSKPEDAQNEVERATLAWFRKPEEAISLVKESGNFELGRLVSPYEERLIELGLLPNKAARQRQRSRYIGAACLLTAVAGLKIILALDRGHKNVGFLIVLASVCLYGLYQIAFPTRTRKGHAVLDDLKKLFSRLQTGSLEPGKSSAEVMWMAAVFGLGALAFSHVEKLYPKLHKAGYNSGGCGSSCGSSCGGGGCGGGCGGCGG